MPRRYFQYFCADMWERRVSVPTQRAPPTLGGQGSARLGLLGQLVWELPAPLTSWDPTTLFKPTDS